MKTANIVAAAMLAALGTLSVPAFAQAAGQPAQMSPVATKDGVPGTRAAGQWVPPYGQAMHEKTRAEVYAELVHAEQDGQIKYLDSTLYSH
ncbi:DUF4148 domain-containing protein [Burkholderia vietnamiensis]|uniref:DUF4148 domain-containing protein n=1 Tax=Burkholderia vietnamiensis TaxID=60552 RepID=UPI0007575C37|nr:DUF4148 domain-containing protein [Burkholderia vietnamiensis]AOJ17059.1 hypothetical protein WJ02_25625 [Burkholderia vietnamiensis]KVF02953.1 hypothetical protein WJ03_02410 [Burkholderia vietnamiensis]MBR8219233.1 DUF4148 domain-containing protein [Burkholderia vietnamiensis]MBR8284781.1 DUF4148 domain-containing protein [Burkholderia vietnamiensis]MCA8016553.1 DUF4148 domain-containing protein [Burkholderia vietnamiensis]